MSESDDIIGDMVRSLFGEDYLDKANNEPDSEEAFNHVWELHEQKKEEARLLKKTYDEYCILKGKYGALEESRDEAQNDVEYLTTILYEIHDETDVDIEEFDDSNKLDVYSRDGDIDEF